LRAPIGDAGGRRNVVPMSFLKSCHEAFQRNDLFCVGWGVKLYSVSQSTESVLRTNCSQRWIEIPASAG